MKVINFAIVRFSGFLVAGILVAHFFPISLLILEILIALFVGVFILWLFARQELIQKSYFGMVVYISFFAIGYLSYQLKKPEFQPTHYTYMVSESTSDLFQIKIHQSIKPDKFNSKYFADVQAVNGNASLGRILLSISNDSLQRIYASDDVLLIYAPLLEIPKSLNPHQFDYAVYLENLEIFGQLRISSQHILTSNKGSKTLFGMAQNIRSKAVVKLQMTKISPNERAIIQALVLGEKKDISKQLYEEYAAAGAVHILAVSGLHVSVIYFVLGFIFNPLKRLKHGDIIHSIIIVILLWSFAFLTGLSPSVSRAVTMFSCFAIATVFGRRTNSLNTLFLSFLTLLTINPLWLFQVGFQLSYSAVFFILWIYPSIRRRTYSKYQILRMLKEVVAVSTCAQLGVLPLSLYYFHQFPGLFLLTNLVILPFLTIFMCGGILIVILAFIDALPDWIAQTYNFMVQGLNAFIHWVSVQDAFLFKDIHFSTIKVLATYLLFIATIIFFTKTDFRKLSFALFSVIAFISSYIYDDYKLSSSEFIVFHMNRNTLIGNRNGERLTVFKKDTTASFNEIFPIKSYKIGVATKIYKEESLADVFRKNEKNIILLDSLVIIPKKKRIHTVILTGSPKVNLNRLIDSLQPERIIADGSNYPSYIKRWQQSCKIKNLSFHNTAEEGALIID